MNVSQCKSCGNTQLEVDSSRGISFCNQCGSIQENNSIVSELTFSNNKVHGSFYNQKTGQGALFQGKRSLFSDSRQLRLVKGYKIVEGIASQLEMSSVVIEAGQSFFQQAYQKNFIQGRNTKIVAAVCLYIACRYKNSPYLLIDFSDVLQTNVFNLARCYLQIIQKLHLEIPLVDPSIYIHRFCQKLEFGSQAKSLQVANTSLRLLQSMQRDWISTGRRPNGLCGAAILIAARYHGFKRNSAQIVKVVHVCEETIRKRLDEFKQTKTAQLTREEFQNNKALPSDEQMDPPSFTRILKRCEKALAIEDDKGLKAIQDKMKEQEEIFNEKLKGEEQVEIETQLVPFLDPSFLDNIKESQSEIQENSDDDEEINKLILSPEERRLKTIIWNNLNKDWLKEQAEKKKKEEAKGDTKKRKKKEKREEGQGPSSAYEAVMKSSKFQNINPKIFQSMFNRK